MVLEYHPYHLMSTVNLVHATINGDDLIAYMARVSNPENQDNTEASDKSRHNHLCSL